MKKITHCRTFLMCLLLVLLIGPSLMAQQEEGKFCRTDEQMELLYQANPHSRTEQRQRAELMINSQDTQRRGHRDSYVIPVVFHVFGTTFNPGTVVNDAIIKDALLRTNEDFQGLNEDYSTIAPPFDVIKEPLDITFSLAQLDPQGNPTTGIVYHAEAGGMGHYNSPIVPQVAWDNSKYMNVYITRDLYGDGDYYNSGVAWLPDTHMTQNNLARVVYNGSFLGSNTSENFRSVLTHEFGHFLDLHHTFHGSICNDDPLAGDMVADTPSHKDNSSGTKCAVIFNCLDQQINNENFMDYTDCYKMFTSGQVDRMVNALDNSSARNTLWTPSNLAATGLDRDLGARVLVSSTSFDERYLNDGIVESTIDLIATDVNFSMTSGTYVAGLHYTASNVPAGLTLRISAADATKAIVSLEGRAVNHHAINTVSDLEIVFLDPMIQGGASSLYTYTVSNISILFNDPYTEACAPTIGYGAYNYISNVSFDGRSNETVNTYFTNYSNELSYPVRAGETYPLSITTNRGKGNDVDNIRIQIWVDWNGDFVYENSELLTSATYRNSDTDQNGDYTYTTDIQVPTGAAIGKIAMRIMAHYVFGTDGDTACGYIDSGEIEDYGLNIIDQNASFSVDFSGMPQAVNFSEPVSFADLSIADNGDRISAWLWTFDGASIPTSTEQNPKNILYKDAGEFDVSLQVTTANGKTETITKENYIKAELRYCETSPDYGGYFSVNHVKLEGIDHNSGKSNYYDYYNTVNTALAAGALYPITITSEQGAGGGSDTNRVKVWADWNFDSQFSMDELMVDRRVTANDYDENGNFTFTADLAVPYHAAVGKRVALRIVGHFEDGSSGLTACGTIDSGNALDYGIDIVAGVPGITALASSDVDFPFNQPLVFTDRTSSSSPIMSWEWAFEGGTPATFTGQTPPAISYNTPGIYSYSLTATNSDDLSDTYTSTVNAVVGYCATSPNYGSYFSVNNVVFETINHTPGKSNYYDYYNTINTEVAAGGSYPITITSELGNGGSKDYNRVKVWADWNFDGQFSMDELMVDRRVIGTDYDANGNFTFTSNIAVPFNAAVGQKVGFRIVGHFEDNEGGLTACGEFDSGNALDYGVTIISGDSGVTAFASPSSEEFPISEPLVYTDRSTTSSAITNWEWTFEGGTPATFTGQTPPAISYIKPGVYNYSLTVTNTEGVTDTYSASVTGVAEYCATAPRFGTYFNINHVKVGTIDHAAQLSNYYNYFDSVTTDLEAGKSYAITINSELGNGGDRDTNAVKVWADWNYDGAFSEDELIVSRNVVYADYVNGEFEFTETITVPLDAAVENKIALRVIGHYVPSGGGVVIENACGSFESGNALDYGVYITPSTLGVPNFDNLEVKIFPNPVQSNLYIQTSSEETISLAIFNLLGQKVFEQTYSENKSLIEIPLGNLNEGLYFIKGKQNDKTFTKKIIIKH